MNNIVMFQVTRLGDRFRVNYNGGTATWDDDKTVREFFNMWMKENKLVSKRDGNGNPIEIIVNGVKQKC